jgi:hypothetical protein
MEAAGIELLLVVDPSNMNYLTGYDGWSFGGCGMRRGAAAWGQAAAPRGPGRAGRGSVR